MEDYRSKIKDQPAMQEAAEKAKGEGKKVVFTNGCFDILHLGHIRYLSEAKKCGDYLIVGVNSDKSMRAIKGEDRPVIPEQARAELLAALCFVDGVIIFDEEDPLALIQYLQPQVLVKGEDWMENEIVGADLVKKAGGEVKRIPLVPHASTSDIVQKIVDLYSRKNN
ncbi:MAG: D-glycero-beta-D-manno-heptose 1-phosphate adenylyltransferase [Deltaproteobacteria bacterium]|nr:D-glycero-beta-D-manno-heptose 1-phosphate adenylyltransferase [Deltaproteobacteria bacterium]MBW2340487.1 D-glycero-beta-D-manno-heptose 1-phosphate adenylyltransferase [Deltaproteobacteria bacterium]